MYCIVHLYCCNVTPVRFSCVVVAVEDHGRHLRLNRPAAERLAICRLRAEYNQPQEPRAHLQATAHSSGECLISLRELYCELANGVGV